MMNIADALAHHVTARPDQAALVAGDRVVLYRDLDGLVRRWAAHLTALGLQQGEVVGIALRDSMEHMLALWGAARMGAVALPLDWRWTTGEQQAVALRFRARLVLVEPGAAPLEGLRCVPVDEGFAAAVESAPADLPFPTGRDCGGMPLLMSLSSGTTGRPKGPVVTHEQFIRRFWTHWIDLGLNSREVYVSATPLYFGGGRTFPMSLMFSGGTAVLFPPPYKPQELAAEIEKRQATSAFLVPTLLRRLLDLSDEAAAPLRKMRLLLSSGAPLHPWERKAIRDRLCAGFHEYYASTEGGGISLLRPEDIDGHEASVGRAVFGVEIAIFDEAMNRLGAGEVGRIGYRGPGVASGFFEDPEADAEVFHEGWFLPGDLASVDASGYVTLKGRKKDMIIRGGVNIYPPEIESVLLSDPRIAEAAVVGFPSASMGEEIAAFVVPRPGEAPSAESLEALCRARLAPYKVPKRIELIADLPRNSSGKTVKAELAKRLTAG
ncbi:class I adenylate-forming enzyme family protein [Falsiroseomonas stagni]|uniref:Fatty-acyl-CoA synthase n=1 Tax=Falsiroseomonas stagni DSM 19981 TaxID=1123062 RepID=A0A1I4A288_9PROT|nr:AMP-binding protein [Falsiroseomonas stagni]SFK50474.1 fatty-acyl-CoA synthase [Falsiroseomonas stagni DSM 19981]